MFHKPLYEILSSDEQDDNSTEALEEVQELYPSITSLDGLEYYYQSLKTLLGDSTADWAKNKIFFEKYFRKEDNWLSKDANLPLITINTVSPIVKTADNSGKELEATVKIEVRADEDESTKLIRNLVFRIRRILEPRTSADNRYLERYCEEFLNYSVSYINLSLLRLEPFLGDYACLFYKTTITYI